MKCKICHKFLSALCALALMLSLIPAAQAAGTPAASDNIMDQYYQMTGKCVTSHLYVNSSGGLTRVELIGKEIVVEDYSSSFAMLSQRRIPVELEYYGGFFAGTSYNFLIFGQKNPSENNSAEVVRVVKYDKSWNRLSQASVYGANTTSPFSSGSVRCAESGGMLYIHTCHVMYKSNDGKNHQANMNIVVRQSDMQVTETGCGIGGHANYVSHSFNQFIIVDSLGNILTADLGDAHPRALVIHKMPGVAGSETMTSNQTVSVQTERFEGATGDNLTNAQPGGLVETSSGYLVAYEQSRILAEPSQMKLAYIAKADFGAGSNTLQIRQLTNNTASYKDETAPFLVPTGLSGGWILWNTLGEASYVEDKPNLGLNYATYSADGSVGPVQTLNKAAPLSDCQPIYYNGKVVWYTTADSAPVFYSLDASGVTATPANGSPALVVGEAEKAPTPIVSGSFSDVPASHWAYQDISRSVSLGAVTGYADGTFRPEDTITVPQFALMLERVFCPDELKEFQEKYAGKPWYFPACQLANDGGGGYLLFHYLQEVVVDWQNEWKNAANMPLTRFQMASMAEGIGSHEKGYISVKEYGYLRDVITDYDSTASVENPWWGPKGSSALACIHAGIMTGMPDGSFSGNATVTRAQACAVINRLYDYVNS